MRERALREPLAAFLLRQSGAELNCGSLSPAASAAVLTALRERSLSSDRRLPFPPTAAGGVALACIVEAPREHIRRTAALNTMA